MSKVHAGTDITFHILTDESVTKQQQTLIQSVITDEHHHVRFYPMSRKQYEKDERWKGGFTLPPAAYYRLSLAEVLPKDIDRVLYLDGDIAINGRLDELFSLDLNDAPLMASLSFPPNIKKHTARLKYDKKFGYFNSGVLLINLKWWREHNAITMYEQTMLEHADLIVLHDQDVLNIAFAQQKAWLPVRYNAQPWLFSELEASTLAELKLMENDIENSRSNPIVIHYCGRAKPWHTDCDHPFRDVFIQSMSETPWRDMKMHKSWKDGSFSDKFYHIVGSLKKALRLRQV